MLGLNDNQREAVLNYFYDSDIAYLVELIMDYVPEDIIRNLAERLTKDNEV
jgi:hypothetical protein